VLPEPEADAVDDVNLPAAGRGTAVVEIVGAFGAVGLAALPAMPNCRAAEAVALDPDAAGGLTDVGTDFGVDPDCLVGWDVRSA
jgi:hypothetical protein